MLTPYLEASVQVVDRDYESMVEVVSSILVSARGDAGKILRDAYHALSSEKDPKIRDMKMEFIERVRLAYVSMPR